MLHLESFKNFDKKLNIKFKVSTLRKQMLEYISFRKTFGYVFLEDTNEQIATFELTRILFDDGENSPCNLYDDDDDDDSEMNGCSMDDVFWDLDSISQQFTEYGELLMDIQKSSNDYEELLDESPLMFIERVEIVDKYRGVGIGNLIFKKINKLATGHVLALKAFPLQHTGQAKNDELQKRFNTDEEKVIAFWKKQGFIQVKDTKFFYQSFLR
jgi:hypothetical protein